MANLLNRPSHANVLSTTHLLGATLKFQTVFSRLLARSHLCNRSTILRASFKQNFYCNLLFTTYFLDHSIFVFNHRSIGQSSGTFDLKSLLIGTVNAYYFLMDVLGYLHSILLYTHSLGGLHATQGAALIQKKFPEAKLSAGNDRPLREIGMFTKAFLKQPRMGAIASRKYRQ